MRASKWAFECSPSPPMHRRHWLRVWWTLTGSYGRMPPLDFNNSQIRKQQLEALGVNVDARGSDVGCYDVDDQEGEEEMRDRLDLHQLVGQHPSTLYMNGEHPPLTAEQVIEEIDEIYQNHDLIRS